MWRMIVISFAFLGIVFYVASGGADYTPAPNSLQVALRDKPFFASSPPPPIKSTDNEAIVPPPITSRPRNDEIMTNSENTTADIEEQADLETIDHIDMSLLWEDEEREAGLARPTDANSLNDSTVPQPPVEKIGNFNAQTLAHDVRSVPITEAVIAAQPLADIREIVSSSAIMRSGPSTDFDRIDELIRGTRVEVLSRLGAWVELRDLQTDQIGWVADRLLTAAH